MRGTIACISGAVEAVSDPSGDRNEEPEGTDTITRIAMPIAIARRAIIRPRFSFGPRTSNVGMSDRSASSAVDLSRGSMTLSVRYQPTPTMTRHDALVKNQFDRGLTVRAGSRICAADCVRPESSGSRLEGTKFAENPPDTPAKAAAIPASGCLPAA